MTASDTPATANPAAAALAPWTCPFCALLCDDLTMPADDRAALGVTDCPRARAAWAGHGITAGGGPWIDGSDADDAHAVAVAAELLAGMHQPLFGGCATDVGGARALYRLAARTGAICDHVDGAALTENLRALQDRGATMATLGELRARAHTLLCIGTSVLPAYPRFFERIGVGSAGSPCRRVLFLGAGVPDGIDAEAVPGSGDLAGDLQALAALVAGREPRGGAPALRALAAELLAAPYTVMVVEGARLPAHGALLIETIHRIAASLNRGTRAAVLGLGGNDGAASVQQTVTWLSGLPLRTRVARDGLRHEPVRFDATRLLDRAGADGLLWVDAFSPTRPPPVTSLPRVILGVPALGERLRADGAAAGAVFLPVATPGLNAAGHLFRTDGPVLLHLPAARDDGLPTVEARLGALLAALGEGVR